MRRMPWSYSRKAKRRECRSHHPCGARADRMAYHAPRKSLFAYLPQRYLRLLASSAGRLRRNQYRPIRTRPAKIPCSTSSSLRTPAAQVQLTITAASYAAADLTQQSLLPNYPSIAGIQTQPFPIATGETGLALDNDPSQPDQISDVWFGNNGHLYQLTAHGDGFSRLLPIAHSITLP